MKVSPFCDSKRIAHSQYGLPRFSPGLEKAFAEKKAFWGAAALATTTLNGTVGIAGHLAG
jgi:hypothetical protein